jgi:hypothetical protein
MKGSQALTVVRTERSEVSERRAATVALPIKEGIQDLLVAYPP